MEQLTTNIKTTIQEFLTNLEKFETKNNKAAAKRARKNSLQLEKLFKEFRKESIQTIK